MNVRHSFSISNIFYDKMDLRLFYFDVTICLSAVHLVNLIFFFLVHYSQGSFMRIVNFIA